MFLSRNIEESAPHIDACHGLETSYLHECISRNRANIARGEFSDDTRFYYDRVLEGNIHTAPGICRRVDTEFFGLHHRDLKNDFALRRAVTKLATECFEDKKFRPDIYMLIFDLRGRLLFILPEKAVEDGNWSVIQGGFKRGVDIDILDTMYRESEEEGDIKASQICNPFYLGCIDIPGKTKGGFTDGKRNIGVGYLFTGDPEALQFERKIHKSYWASKKDEINAKADTMRPQKAEFFRGAWGLAQESRMLTGGILVG